MRLAVIALLALTAAPALAQQTSAPPSSIGLPLPPIGLPLPVIGIQPAGDPIVTPFDRRPGERPRRRPAEIVFFGAPYAFGFEPWELSPEPGMIAPVPYDDPLPPPPPVVMGKLLLIELTPSDAQLFVDGEYVGTWSDLHGELELTPGPHRLDIRARGYEAQALDVRITGGRTISYRGGLVPLAPPPVDVARSEVPSGPFYLIPGCYLGNVHPSQVKLPAGCDLSRLVIHRPPR
jgi:hypothetical protein